MPRVTSVRTATTQGVRIFAVAPLPWMGTSCAAMRTRLSLGWGAPTLRPCAGRGQALRRNFDERRTGTFGRMAVPELWLARHGETAWTLSRQHTGRTDLPLTEDGERVAREELGP